MTEYSLQRKYVGAILNGHFSEGMSKSMRTTANVFYIRHAPILGDAPPNTISIHLFVIVRNKQPINWRIASRFNISAKQSFGLPLNRHESIFAVLFHD